MATIDSNTFYKYQEHRATTGYKAALCVKEQNAEKYSMLIASTTVPSVFGSYDSVEFDVLNSPSKGKIQGKMTLEDKEVEFLNHRDNIYRLNKLKDKVLDFMYVTPDFVGYKFSGKIAYRTNDATADVLMGTYTITPMSAEDTPVFNCRGLVEETLCFADVIPESIDDKTDGTVNKLNLTLSQGDVSATYKWFNIGVDGKETTGGALSATKGVAEVPTVSASGLIGITASAAGYADWTTTIYVNKTE